MYSGVINSFTHSLTRSRDILDGRTAGQYWWLPEICLLTEPPDSTGGYHSALADKLGVSLSQYHPTMVHIANHPGMNNRPVEDVVLRCQSHLIIANLTINTTGNNSAHSLTFILHYFFKFLEGYTF
jgi:hypothetical protein